MSFDATQVAAEVKEASAWVEQLRSELGRVVVGQRYMIDRMLVGLLADGHLLLEGVPGLAKTTAVKAFSDAISTDFKRIQFTPDLLPADLIGTQIYNPTDGTFRTRRGPLFSNIVLADEINRAAAKVQSALLEAMAESQVTIGDESHGLPGLFLVMATQNPIEQEGTYPLPEAQVDRFMMKLRVDYPSRDEEREILRRSIQGFPKVRPVVNTEAVFRAREVAAKLNLDGDVADYIVDLVLASRDPASVGLERLAPLIEFGGSPRATIYLERAARSWAFLQGRAWVNPQDVKTMAPDILRHRILLSYEAEAEGLSTDDVVRELLNHVPTP